MYIRVNLVYSRSSSRQITGRWQAIERPEVVESHSQSRKTVQNKNSEIDQPEASGVESVLDGAAPAAPSRGIDSRPQQQRGRLVDVSFYEVGTRKWTSLKHGDREPLGKLLALYCEKTGLRRHQVMFEAWESEVLDTDT